MREEKMKGFSNTQLIMITEIKVVIEQMKEEGKGYKEIRQACLNKFRESHWLITNQKQRDEAIAGALFAYGMDEEQRKAVLKLKEVAGYLLV